MGENITLPIDVFVKIIEGQSRIEAKLDAHITNESTIESRMVAAEQALSRLNGAKENSRDWTTTGIAIAGALTSVIALFR